MRVLFLLKDSFYLRNFESLLRELDDRGHEVQVTFDTATEVSYRQGLVELLGEELSGFATGLAPARGSERWRRASDELRRALDYLAYLEPRYDGAPTLRARAARWAPEIVRRLGERGALRSRPLRRALGGLLALAEAGVPASRTLTRYIVAHRADVVLVSPLVRFGSTQADFLVAARRAGVPACFCAYSWDNLTTKGRIRGDPDLVTVWNDVQAREAVEIHAVAPDRAQTVGATAYDHWFGWRPSTSREQFCAAVGLRPDRPVLLYVGSALLSGKEEEFIAGWIRRLRCSTHPELREVGVLVRPHPQRPPAAGRLDSALDANAAVWPSPEARALGLEARQALFDSIFHATAVVGLNTSAFIDAAIIGRPSYAILPPEFADSQEGTLHFRHLLEAGEELLAVAPSFETHALQLAERLSAADAPVSSERFVSAFVRPAGLEVAATQVLADAIERQVALGPRRPERSPLERAAGLALALGLSEVVRARDAFHRVDGPRRVRRSVKRTRKGLGRTARRGRGLAGAALRYSVAAISRPTS